MSHKDEQIVKVKGKTAKTFTDTPSPISGKICVPRNETVLITPAP